METLMFNLIAISSELDNLRTSKLEFTIFLVITCFIVIGFLLIFLLIIIHYLRSFKKYNEEENWHSKEIFRGLRNSSVARLFPILFFSLRIATAVIFIFLIDAKFEVKLGSFFVFHFFFFLFLVLVRPYKHVRDNIIEVLLELNFVTVLAFLFYLNKYSKWNSTFELAMLSLLVAGPVIASVISGVFMIKALCARCCKKKPKIEKVEELPRKIKIAPITARRINEEVLADANVEKPNKLNVFRVNRSIRQKFRGRDYPKEIEETKILALKRRNIY